MVPLIAMWLQSACADEDRFSMEVIQDEGVAAHRLEEPQRVLRGTVEFRVGVAAGGGPEEFSEISGLALDSAGHVIVVDRSSNEVRVFSPSGEFLYRFGGRGSGPGELIDPCCPSFDTRGLLWVRDRGNGRFNAYALERPRARYMRRVRSVTSGRFIDAPLIFHPEGTLIDVGAVPDGRAGYMRITRHHISDDGSEVDRQDIPRAPSERAPTLHEGSGPSLLPWRSNQTTGSLTIPAFLPRHVIAHSPAGEWAELVTSDYLIRWYDDTGSLRQIIVGDVGPGPRLTESQREFQARQIERRGAIPGFEPVERRPPLRRLFFDRDGRLWVRHATPDGPARADVIAPDGTYEAAVEWPRGVRLDAGFVTGMDALGVTRTSSGITGAVRLRFAESGPVGGRRRR